MVRTLFLAALAAALAAPALAQVPPPIRVTAKGKEVVPVLISPPAPPGSQFISAPVLQICHGGGGAAAAVILASDPETDEADTVETVVAAGQCVFVSARRVRLTTNTEGGNTAILVQLVG